MATPDDHAPDDRAPDDHALAAAVAAEAGARLVALRESLAGAAAAEVGTRGDQVSHRFISSALAAARPGEPVLSEEGADDLRRLRAQRVWVVDPLDGTREFGEGRTDWAVHVALVVGGRPVAAAVALPSRGLTLHTGAPPGPLPPHHGPIRLVVSRSRPPAMASAVAARLRAELVVLGSAGAKAMAVVLGEAEAYVHEGGQYEWDSAAPVAVATAAGLHVSRLDGSTLQYNQADPWLPDLLVCRADVAGAILAAVSLR